MINLARKHVNASCNNSQGIKGFPSKNSLGGNVTDCARHFKGYLKERYRLAQRLVLKTVSPTMPDTDCTRKKKEPNATDCAQHWLGRRNMSPTMPDTGAAASSTQCAFEDL